MSEVHWKGAFSIRRRRGKCEEKQKRDERFIDELGVNLERVGLQRMSTLRLCVRERVYIKTQNDVVAKLCRESYTRMKASMVVAIFVGLSLRCDGFGFGLFPQGDSCEQHRQLIQQMQENGFQFWTLINSKITLKKCILETIVGNRVTGNADGRVCQKFT